MYQKLPRDEDTLSNTNPTPSSTIRMCVNQLPIPVGTVIGDILILQPALSTHKILQAGITATFKS